MLINLFNRFATSPLIRFRKARRRSAQRCQASSAMTERLEERRLLTFGFADSGQLLTGVDPQGGNTADVVLADFDGDSDLDAAVANRNFDSPNQVYINRGDGYFTTSVALPAVPVWGLTEDLEAGDLDGDGDVDLVTSSFRQDWPQVLLNDGNANFTLAATLSGQRLVARGSALGDLNGDGDLDAIFSSQRISGNDVFVNDGLGNFTFSQTLARSGLGATRYQIGLADVDGDGDVDVLNNMSDGRYIDLWTNNGSGSFSLQSTISTQGRNWCIVTGDVDLDGDIDFYAAGENRQGMFLNNGSGSFTEFVNPTQINFDHSAALGDLDGDGDLDIFQGRGSSMDSGSESPDKVWFNGLDPVTNTDPELTANSAIVTVNEGQVASNSGTVSDADGDAVALSASAGSVINNNDGTWSWSLATDDGPAGGTGVTISGDDGNGGTASAAFTVIVNNVAPDASLSGAASGLVGDAISFTLGATDASSADQAAGFTYAIDWNGDGNVDQTVSGADGLSVSHSFATGGSTTVIVTATDKDGGTSSAVSHAINLIQPVSVDVKPGNSQNQVNLKSQGVIPVAIYTTADFNAATVVGSSVKLAGVSAQQFALEDVDGDGDLDMILHFNTQAVINALGVNLNSGESVTVNAKLTGETIDQVMIQGFDTIEFFQPGKGNGKK